MNRRDELIVWKGESRVGTLWRGNLWRSNIDQDSCSLADSEAVACQTFPSFVYEGCLQHGLRAFTRPALSKASYRVMV